jgi:prolyl oligopeptidase
VTPFPYPAADREDVVEELFGQRIPDPYRWLEDPTDPRTVTWSAGQDELARGYLDGLPGRERLRARLATLLAAGSVGPPVWRDGRCFFTRREPGQELAVLLVREPDGTERPLVDPIAVDPTGTTTLDSWAPSIEGDRLAYQLSRGGDEESLLYVLDVATGERVEGPIDRCRYSPVGWLPGGEEFFFVRRLAPDLVPADERQFHRRVWLHRVGTDPDAADLEIFGAGLELTNYYSVAVSRDGRWLVVEASAGTAPRTDAWIAEVVHDRAGDRAAPTMREIQVGVDAQLSAWVRDGRLYLETDRDAPRGRLCVADPADPAYPGWRDVVPEQPDATLSGLAILEGGQVLAAHTHDASDRLTWWSPAGERLGEVTGLGVGSVTGLTSRPEGGRQAWVGYTDFVTPPMVLTTSLGSPATVSTWAAAPGSVDVSGIEVSEVHYPSADGTPIHAFVVSRSGRPDRPRPAVLYGYGGFNVALTPSYSASILTWVEAGGIWVVANLRGGSEHGEQWHRAGMRDRKQNVFDDFVAVAEGLAADGWSAPDRLASYGGSNGGLLVGAAVTQRPELFSAAVCSAPLLDMVRYEKFGLGRTWNDEFGTAGDPTELGWLLDYSPYHRVREGVRYPAVMFTTFESDTRVDPMHARKMCAALQAASAATDRPVLLRRETEVGHGTRSISRMVGLGVDQLAFFAARLGLPL